MRWPSASAASRFPLTRIARCARHSIGALEGVEGRPSAWAHLTASSSIHSLQFLQVSLTPLAADDNYVAAIWSSNEASTYRRFSVCPSSAQVGQNATDSSTAALRAATATAFKLAIYGTEVATTSVSSITWSAAGTVTVSRTSPAATLEYAITEVWLANRRFKSRGLQLACTGLGWLYGRPAG